MKNVVKWSSLALAVAAGNGMLASSAMAEGEGFIEGASATLYNRTVYFNRDFRDGRDSNGRGKREESATSLLMNFESGFTQGPIGFGADVIASMGIKLDSGRGRSGTGLLPVDGNNDADDEYSEIRGAVKMAILDDTVLRYGVHMPENPVAAYDDSRLLPNHYEGYSITNNSIDALFVEAGRLTDRSEMNEPNETDGATVDGEDLTYAGGTYSFSDNLSATLYGAKSEDAYKRGFFGADWTMPLGENLSLNTNFAYYDTSDEASADGTEFDNKAGSLAFTLNAGYHAFGLAYQKMSGDGRYEYRDGEIFIANSVQYLDFNAKDEKSYQVRYDYDFEGMGVPGLSFMTRYITSSDIDTTFESAYNGTTVNRDSRWERDSELKYTVQNGALEGLNVRWRNATVRQDAGIDNGDVDENRLIVGYTWNLL